MLQETFSLWKMNDASHEHMTTSLELPPPGNICGFKGLSLRWFFFVLSFWEDWERAEKPSLEIIYKQTGSPLTPQVNVAGYPWVWGESEFLRPFSSFPNPNLAVALAPSVLC